MPRYEILSEDALAVLDGGWRRLVSELGVQFDHPRALELLRLLNVELWRGNGALDAAARATTLWREALDPYEEPPLDGAVAAELDEYVARRRRELGD